MSYPDVVEVEFDWHLTNRCNFDCVYCHPQIKRVLNVEHLDEPSHDLVVRRFDELGKICAIHMSGGEPLLYPDFVELCAGLTRRHYISMNSNLSRPDIVRAFAARLDPERVSFVHGAVHKEERELLQGDLTAYVESYRALRDRGFPVTALYVLYPPLLPRLQDDLKQLRSAGVERINAKVFKGLYEGKRYPEAYTAEERSRILAASGEYLFNQAYIDGQMCFKGRFCSAGRRSFKVDVTGAVRRCASVKGDYGNLYEGTFRPDVESRPCSANRVLVVSQCHRYLEESPLAIRGARGGR